MDRNEYDRNVHDAIGFRLPVELFPNFYGGANHSLGVMKRATSIGMRLNLPSSELQILKLSSLLHDVGKILIRSELIRKPGKLTEKEWREMKLHPVFSVGYIHKFASHFNWCERVSEIVLHHHAHWNGTGYPGRLMAGEIPFLSRVLAYADAYDALMAPRKYHEKGDVKSVLREVSKMKGTCLDPRIVAVGAYA